jgi:hypothetical protein
VPEGIVIIGKHKLARTHRTYRPSSRNAR